MLSKKMPYGSWINAKTTEVHDVEKEQQHREWMKGKWVEIFGREFDDINSGDGLLSTPLSIGFIRASYKGKELHLEGDEKFLKEGFSVLRDMAKSFSTVMIDIHDTGEWLAFNISDKKEMYAFMNWGKTPINEPNSSPSI